MTPASNTPSVPVRRTLLLSHLDRDSLEAKCAHHEWERDYWYRELQKNRRYLRDAMAFIQREVAGDYDLWEEAVRGL